ncbi:MAG: hypothetical protein WC477_04170 [Patescibacteria group bacterium]
MELSNIEAVNKPDTMPPVAESDVEKPANAPESVRSAEIAQAAEQTLLELQKETIAADFGPPFIRKVIQLISEQPQTNRQDIYLQAFASLLDEVKRNIVATYPEITTDQLEGQIFAIYTSIVEDISHGQLGAKELEAAERVLHPQESVSAPSISSIGGVQEKRS